MKRDVSTPVLFLACGVMTIYADVPMEFSDDRLVRSAQFPVAPSDAAVDSARFLCKQDLLTFCHVPSGTVRDMANMDPFYRLVTTPFASRSADLVVLDLTPLDVDGDEFDLLLGQLLDQMMGSAIAFGNILGTPTDSDSAQAEHERWKSSEDAAEEVLDVFVNSFLGHAAFAASASADQVTDNQDTVTLPEENMYTITSDDASSGKAGGFDSLLSRKIAERARDMIETNDEPRRRLARRLTEVKHFHGLDALRPANSDIFDRVLSSEALSTSTSGHSRPTLKFGPAKDQCLWNAFDNGRVSWPCGRALQKVCDESLYTFENNEFKVTATPSEHPKLSFYFDKDCCATTVAIAAIFISLAMIYTLLFITRHRRGFHKSKHHRNFEHRRIKKRMMHTIYTTPSIKATIEEAIGESIGETPPCMRHGTDHDERSSSKCLGVCDCFFHSLPLACLSLFLLFTAVSAPCLVVAIGLPTLMLMTLYQVFKICFCSSRCNAGPGYPGARGKQGHEETTVREASAVAYVGIPIQVV